MPRATTLTWREARHRLGDPGLVSSHLLNALLSATAPLLPTQFNRIFCSVKPYTMVSYSRLRALYAAAQHISKNAIAGDVVECGVARGGSAALIALSLAMSGDTRRMWLFDTFSGIPSPTNDDPDFEVADLYTGKFRSSVGEVSETLRRLNAEGGVEFVPGLFQETVPQSAIRSIALLHLDGDWYESVKVCLESFYDRVLPGGIIQFDDYGYWAGARRAVDEFVEKRRIKSKLRKIDHSGRQLMKE